MCQLSKQYRTLITEHRLSERIAELGRQIARDCHRLERLHVLALLNGAFVFAADLARSLRKADAPPVSFSFLKVQTYVSRRKSAVLPGNTTPTIETFPAGLRGRHVLVVDDILDQGITLRRIRDVLQEEVGVASLRICVLLRKDLESAESAAGGTSARTVPVDYVGFDIPDVWVAGYGMDAEDGTLRDLPYVVHLPDSGG